MMSHQILYSPPKKSITKPLDAAELGISENDTLLTASFSSSSSNDDDDCSSTSLFSDSSSPPPPTSLFRRRLDSPLPWLQAAKTTTQRPGRRQLQSQIKQMHFSDFSVWLKRKQRTLDGIKHSNPLLRGLLLFFLLLLLWWVVGYCGRDPLADLIGELPTPEQGKAIVNAIQRTVPGQMYTIHTTCPRHMFQLVEAIHAYSQCPRMQQIRVDCHGRGDSLPSRVWDHPKVVVVGEETSASITTSAVLLLDPTLPSTLLSCADLDRAFAEWRRDATQMVGFGSSPSSQANNEYSLASDRALFVHSLYLSVLPHPRPTDDEDCREFALAAKWSAIFQSAPATLLSAGMPTASHVCYQRLIRATRQASLPSNDRLVTGR